MQNKKLQTVLQPFTPILIILMACKTINPAIIALVDAMAGIMFPAIATNRFD